MNAIKLCLVTLFLLVAGCAVPVEQAPELEPASAECGELAPIPELAPVCFEIRRYCGTDTIEFHTHTRTVFTCTVDTLDDCVQACAALEAEQNGEPPLHATSNTHE